MRGGAEVRTCCRVNCLKWMELIDDNKMLYVTIRINKNPMSSSSVWCLIPASNFDLFHKLLLVTLIQTRIQRKISMSTVIVSVKSISHQFFSFFLSVFFFFKSWCHLVPSCTTRHNVRLIVIGWSKRRQSLKRKPDLAIVCRKISLPTFQALAIFSTAIVIRNTNQKRTSTEESHFCVVTFVLPSKNWKSDAQMLEWIIFNILMTFKWLAMNYLVFLFNYHFTFFLLSCYMMGLTMMFCVFLIFRCLFTWMDGEIKIKLS